MSNNFGNVIDEVRESVNRPAFSNGFGGLGNSSPGNSSPTKVNGEAVWDIVSRTFSFVAKVSPAIAIPSNGFRVGYVLQNQGANPIYWGEGVAPNVVGVNVYGGFLLQPGESYFSEQFCPISDIYVVSLGGSVQMTVAERARSKRGI